MTFDPMKFYREFPAGGNTDRGDWLERCLKAMCEEAVRNGGYVPEGRIIIRTNADATLDEAILKDGKANFHLEQMSATHWWMALTLDQQRIDINLTSRATIKANVSDEGEVKLIDDSCAISTPEGKA